MKKLLLRISRTGRKKKMTLERIPATTKRLSTLYPLTICFTISWSRTTHPSWEKETTVIVINRLIEIILTANFGKKRTYAGKENQENVSKGEYEWVMWWLAPESTYQTEEGLDLPKNPMAEKVDIRELWIIATLFWKTKSGTCLFHQG